MPERKEPGLGDLSPNRRPAPSVTQRANQSVPRSGRSAAKPAPARSGSVLATVLATIAILATGALSYLWYQTSQKQAQSLELLSQQQTQLAERIDRIIADLESNGVATSESQDELKEQDAFLLSEIRKLWDLSNKRNRPDIDSLQAQVAALSEDIASANEYLVEQTEGLRSERRDAIAEVRQTLEQTVAEQAQQQGQALDEMQAALNELPNAQMLNAIATQQQASQTQVLELRLAVESLDEQLSRLSAAAGDDLTLQEWINLVDASRQELAQRINALQIELEAANTP